MNLDFVAQVVPKIVGPKAALVLQAKSPQIMIGAGLVGMVGCTVLACRATLKAPALIQDHKDMVEVVNQCRTQVVLAEDDTRYTEKDYQKDLVITYRNTFVDLSKLYAPSILVGVASVSLILKGQNVMVQRNVALAAAYRLVDDAFKRYRARVIDAYGRDVDHMFRHNLRAEEIIEQEEDENGKKKNVKRTIMVPNDPNKIGLYAFVFDETNPEWKKDATYNRMYLQMKQNWWNDYLQAYGHVFLNEVLHDMGFPQTQAGAVVGWLRSDMPGADGDGYVSFGIFDGEYDINRNAFINGDERSILLDYNVDGVIFNRI